MKDFAAGLYCRTESDILLNILDYFIHFHSLALAGIANTLTKI